MQLRTIVWKELWERPSALLTSGVVIVLGVAAIVAIRHITVHSEEAVAGQLSDLGANILVLPKDASVADYYAADLTQGTIPEEYAATVLLSGLTGVERLSPKLSVPGRVGEHDVTVTGILPQSEFEANASWQTAALFGTPPQKHVGCTRAHCAPDPNAGTPQSLVTLRSIEKLGPREAILGADVARRTNLVEGETITLLGEPFKILAVLPATGAVDDGRVFAHLHSIQDLSKSGPVVNAIEVMGCCEDAAGDLVPQLESLLPDTRVVTISQVVATQVNVNRMMGGASWFVLVISALVGGASLAGTVAANVRERRKEIGTLMALGATPLFISRLFLLKAGWLGFAGGGLGCLLGIAAAILLGPTWAGLSIRPLFGYSLLIVAGATVLALAAALIPARRAARIDPCVCFQEV